jgi:polar amino acid transport system substrate-binding protein
MTSGDRATAALLAPHGVLRAALNFGNTVLVRPAATLEATGGVAPAIARELARRLDVPVRFTRYETAGEVVAAASDDVWDVGFMAVDPKRASEGVLFTAPYVLIEGGYMVRDDSPLASVDEVDRPGIRMTVGERSAYDLYLSRTIRHAEIVRAATSLDGFELFVRDGYDVAAGVKASLAEYVASHSGFRLLPGNFMIIQQAMVTRHEAARAFLAGFIEELKASGFVAAELAASGQASDAVVAPAA